MSEPPACLVVAEYDWEYPCAWCGHDVGIYHVDTDDTEGPLTLIHWDEKWDNEILVQSKSFNMKEYHSHWDCVPSQWRIFYIKEEYKQLSGVSVDKSHLTNLTLGLEEEDDLKYLFTTLEWDLDRKNIGYPAKSMEQRLEEKGIERGKSIIGVHRRREYKAFTWPP
ncbi:hypothetical protein NEOLEDRAFT_1152624 [Neolentinus lepideus HHB14362 ss-1]|uniref:Uncharacterized protein n=1 Tax=Neolentinus lepideus HHB14362 ss-1 TaxID=1314782 RepID=A0A165MJU7_9AGAM|nr:hypothetical protein NEOLEDRAFT_1152624 [Neolentinus lepideus HHB14362 ss-1]